MKKEVMIVTAAGQIGMAIARRVGYGKKIILGDKKPENAEAVARRLISMVRRCCWRKWERSSLPAAWE